MHPGIVGALALIGTTGAIYFGSGYLNDYFAVRNADRAAETAMQSEDVVSPPSTLVGETAVSETPEVSVEQPEAEISEAVDAMTDMAEDAANDAADTASEEIAALADDATEAAAEMAEATQETAVETLERVFEAAPRSDDTAAVETEAAPEPGTTPVLDIVRIEPTGEAVIAGNAPQGERVGLLYNNELIADTPVDAGGDFVLVPDEPIPAGEGTMEIVVIDDAGNTVLPSQEQVAVVLPEDGSDEGFLVGVLRPDEPVDIIERVAPDVEIAAVIEPAIEAVEDAVVEATDVASEAAETEVPQVELAARVEPTQPVTVDAQDATEPFVLVDAIELEGNEMWIAGGALPGTIVRLYQDNIFLGEVVTGDEGRFLYEGSLLDAEGEVTVRADALVNGSADVVARASVPFEVPLSSAQLAAAALEQAEDVAETTTEAATEVAEGVEAATDTAVEIAAEAAEAVQDVVTDAADSTSEASTTAVETATETVTEISEAVGEVATATAEAASETVAEVAVEASEAANAAVESVTETVADIVPADSEPQLEVAATPTPTPAPTSNEASSEPPVAELAAALAEDEEQAAATAASAEQVPAAETASPSSSERPERISVLDTGQVIIRRGDNLWRLSRRVYGQGIRYTSIYDANRDQIGQPELIFPGQVFTLPTPREEWGQVPGLEALDADQIPSEVVETQ